jgi:hypothetical protein
MKEPAPWRAGVATIPITPEERMWLAGWAARREPASGKAMELFAKALALEDAKGQRAVIVTADLLAIPRALAQAVAARVQTNWKLTRQSLLFNVSHTHTAPEVRPDKIPFFEIPREYASKIAPYVCSLSEKLTKIIGASLEKLQPAALDVRRTRVAFVQNRRPGGGPSATEVPILTLNEKSGQPLALVFGLACHNLTLPPTFCQYHGDYAGVAMRELQQSVPGATALFLTGAGADQDPMPRGSVELAEAHGTTLADAVQRALADEGRPITGALNVGFEEVSLDFQLIPSLESLEADVASNDIPRARKAKFLLDALSRKTPFSKCYPCPVQVLKLGQELLLIGLGGEPVLDYALQFQQEFKRPLVWVAGYCNDVFGYLPNRRILREGGYEGGRSLFWSALPAPFEEKVEDRIVDSVRRLVRQVG